MVMVSGAGGLQQKGGRSPPPKRGRLGGGRCAAAPYKHRLAHDPGSRRFGFPGGRSGASGSWGLPQVAFGHFWRVKSATPAVAVQIMPSKRLAPPLGDNRLLPNGSRCAGAGLRLAEEVSPPPVLPGGVTRFFPERHRRSRHRRFGGGGWSPVGRRGHSRGSPAGTAAPPLRFRRG